VPSPCFLWHSCLLVRQESSEQGKGSLWNPEPGTNTILHSTSRQNFTTTSLQSPGTDYTYVVLC
jgi:hypothetical protein